VPNRLTEIAPGVCVATGVLYLTNTTVVAGAGGSCLVIDPAVTPDEIAGIAASASTLGMRPAVGWSTHPHWDHLLWHPSLGTVPRYATAGAVAAAARLRHGNLAEAEREAPGHDPALFGRTTTLDGDLIPWEGPQAAVIVHDGHAPGHGAVFLPDSGVLVAGDMCSDIEIPLLDDDAADPLQDYRTGLSRLAALADVRLVVPGHGHVGDTAEFRRRVAADLAYLDRLERGKPFDDPRVGPDWLRATHQAQLALFAR
jgi:hydroxyacylglutathione hydrolase